MKNSLFLFAILFTLSFSYSACCEDDEQPNDEEVETPYGGCCANSPETYNLDGVDFYIPNSFTPDANGFNDLFLMYSSSYPADFKFQEFILSKSDGETLFQILSFVPGDLSYGWDGKDAGGNDHIGYFQYKLTIEDTLGNIQIFTGSACALNCADAPLSVSNPDQCTFGLGHDGEGGFDPNLDSGENDCF